jgi:flagellar M-ring protein FliF
MAANPALLPMSRTLQRVPAKSLATLMVGAALLVAVIAASIMWVRTPDYRLLYSNLSDKDGGAIVAALAQLNIPYQNTDGGAIMVPADKVHDVRLKLASQGLPKGGSVGFDLMDNQKFGTTQFQEQVNFQRGLEGELARSIQSLSAVQNARVHLAMPKQSVFLRDQPKTSASVVLNLYPGKSLERAQVAGIAHLVASSVPDLTIKNVSILDQNGNLLSALNDSGSAQLNPAQLSYVQEIEQSQVKRIVDILEPIAGRGNVRAQVTADIDFNQIESTAETFKPNQNVQEASVRSQSVSDASAPGSAAAQGVPGALSNQPPATPTAPITGNANSTGPNTTSNGANIKRDTITNYEIDKTVRHMRNQVGMIKRMSAAVVVNHKRVTDSAGKVTPQPFSEQEIAQLNALVKEAIGFTQTRGDTLNLVNSPFSTEPETTFQETPLWQQPETISMAKEGGKALFILIAIGLVVFGLLRPALKQISASLERAPQDYLPDAGSSGAHAMLQLANQHAANSNRIEGARQIARDNPATVANVVRNWVTK